MTTSKRGIDVFSDLGFTPAEAENLRIRSAMMRALINFVRTNKLAPAGAARLLGVTQPRLSDLLRGKIHLFSTDNLVTLLAAAGLRVGGQATFLTRRSVSPTGRDSCVAATLGSAGRSEYPQ